MQCDRAAGKSRISIHAPREGCDYGGRDWYQSLSISIHAPREGCDVPAQVLADVVLISIHAPREGATCPSCTAPARTCSFQSTHPVRGATPMIIAPFLRWIYFNPRTP